MFIINSLLIRTSSLESFMKIHLGIKCYFENFNIPFFSFFEQLSNKVFNHTPFLEDKKHKEITETLLLKKIIILDYIKLMNEN